MPQGYKTAIDTEIREKLVPWLNFFSINVKGVVQWLREHLCRAILRVWARRGPLQMGTAVLAWNFRE